jgi:hypothetical protein
VGDPHANAVGHQETGHAGVNLAAPGRCLVGVVTVVVVCILLLCSCSIPENTSAPNQPVIGGVITPLLESTLSTPRWFTGTDGQPHLVYELMLTNVVPAAVNLSAVEVNSADSGATLIRLAGDALRAATSLVASPETPTTQLPPSSVGVVWVDIPLGGTAVPAATTHRLTIDPPAGIPLSGVAWTFKGPAMQVDQRPPVVVSPPLAGRGWAALGSCCDGPPENITVQRIGQSATPGDVAETVYRVHDSIGGIPVLGSEAILVTDGNGAVTGLFNNLDRLDGTDVALDARIDHNL